MWGVEEGKVRKSMGHDKPCVEGDSDISITHRETGVSFRVMAVFVGTDRSGRAHAYFVERDDFRRVGWEECSSYGISADEASFMRFFGKRKR